MLFETDPVCKMQVMPETAAAKYDHEGRTYYFCATRCMERFKANPQKFLAPPPPESEIPNPQSEMPWYTCPMHPEVRQRGPGSCPKCGMALEPEVASADDEENPELTDMTRRFWIAAVLTAPVLIAGMFEIAPMIQLLLSTPVVLWAGWPLFQRGAASIVNRSPNMCILIAIGTGSGYFCRVVAVLLGLPVYFEAAS